MTDDDHVANIVKPYEARRILRSNVPSRYDVVEGQSILAEGVTLDEAASWFKEQRRVTDPEYRGNL